MLSSWWETAIESIYSSASQQDLDVVGFSGLRALRILRITRLVRLARVARILRFVMALRTLTQSILYTLSLGRVEKGAATCDVPAFLACSGP